MMQAQDLGFRIKGAQIKSLRFWMEGLDAGLW